MNTIWICANFFRYMKRARNAELHELPLDQIDIRDVDLAFVSSIRLTDIYDYLSYPEPRPAAASE